jgi:hypothetical protein
MNIQTAIYQEDGSIFVNDSMTVPVSGGNRDYQAILEWVAEGNVVAPYVVPDTTVQDAKQELANIDIKSIRGMREWIAAQPDAPEFLQLLEASAKAERTKIK